MVELEKAGMWENVSKATITYFKSEDLDNGSRSKFLPLYKFRFSPPRVIKILILLSRTFIVNLHRCYGKNSKR